MHSKAFVIKEFKPNICTYEWDLAFLHHFTTEHFAPGHFTAIHFTAWTFDHCSFDHCTFYHWLFDRKRFTAWTFDHWTFYHCPLVIWPQYISPLGILTTEQLTTWIFDRWDKMLYFQYVLNCLNWPNVTYYSTSVLHSRF